MSRVFSTGWESGHLGIFEPMGSYTSYCTVKTSDEIQNAYPYMDAIERGNYALKIRARGYGSLNLVSMVGSGMREFGIRFRFQTTNAYSHNTFLIGREHETLSSGIIFYARIGGAGGYTMAIDGGSQEYTMMPIESCRWYLIDMYFKLSSSSSIYDGALEVKINGKSQFGLLENILMNQQSSARLLKHLQLWGPTSSSEPQVFSVFDDLIVTNYDDSTSVIEYTDAYTIRGAPSGISSYNYWEPEPSSQESYECVSDVGSSIDNDYIIAKGIGGEGSFPITMDETGTTDVKSVSIQARARKVGDASAYKVRPVLRDGINSEEGTARDLTTTFTDYHKVWEQNPIENRDWDTSDLSSLNIGVKADE